MNKVNDSVLVVEDDAALREALIDTLRRRGHSGAGRPRCTKRAAIARERGDRPGHIGRADAGGQWLRAAVLDQAIAAVPAGGLDDGLRHRCTSGSRNARGRHGLHRQAVRRTGADRHGAAAAGRPRHAQRTGGGRSGIEAQPGGLARRIAENDATVLITGESGTGKEVYARFIRDHSVRADKPFVAINCAAIPENMLEASLFGYEKGAFTGALAAHAGKFEQAQGGTLLLDEISEMDLGLQAKILRVLQEREVERLGSTRTLSLNVRLDRHIQPRSARGGARRALQRRSLLPAQCDVAANCRRCASAAATFCRWRAAPCRPARARVMPP